MKWRSFLPELCILAIVIFDSNHVIKHFFLNLIQVNQPSWEVNVNPFAWMQNFMFHLLNHKPNILSMCNNHIGIIRMVFVFKWVRQVLPFWKPHDSDGNKCCHFLYLHLSPFSKNYIWRSRRQNLVQWGRLLFPGM